ncbi:MAG: hypothetical protein K6B65_04295 [Bacilli bacterium]|nr:hypothetical protein [Bacilli bacterium]
MRFLRTLKRYRNKILAITFVLAGLGFFLADIVCSIIYGFTPDILTIISWVIEGGVLSYLLFTNVRNDSNAYQAVGMWIFLFFLSEIRTVIYSPYSVISLFSSKASLTPLATTLVVFQPVLAIGTLGLGVYLYILVRKYMFGLTSRFARVRLIAILYTVVSFASYAAQIGLLSAMGLSLSIVDFFPGLCKLCSDISVIFTLERLRRI